MKHTYGVEVGGLLMGSRGLRLPGKEKTTRTLELRHTKYARGPYENRCSGRVTSPINDGQVMTAPFALF